ncbi:MAG: adenylate/guanylate cyclase domain-containing protein [Thermoflexales bacterium]|nr:adenylate/guanylate cyclase domain-containing protein [Thermoflexales bacterium]
MAQSRFPPFKTIERQINTVTIVANVLGAMLLFFYSQVIAPLPVGQGAVQSLSAGLLVFFVVVMIVIFAIGIVGAPRALGMNQALLTEWYNRLREGAAPAEVPDSIRRQALNYVSRQAVFNFLMWVVALLLFTTSSLILSRMPFSVWVGGLRDSLIATLGVSSVVTTAIVYFALDVIWRQAIPVFFPDGKLSQARAFRLPVLGRLLIVFLLIGLYPAGLLVSLSLQRARSLVGAPNPEVILNNLVILEGFILGVSVLASVGMAVFVTRSIVGPLRELQAAMGRVEQGNLDVRSPVTTNDELGYLAEGFNAMTEGLRRGEMVRTLLNLYVTPEVARQAVEHGAELGGSLVECTVLFSDIRNFTGLSESMPPAELVTLLNRYMSAMVAAIVEEGGMVNKFGGDSLLAVFGTPLNPRPDHAACAVRAAFGMQRALERFNQAQVQAQAPILHFGIGIASGPVIAGNVGGQERLEYTVIGDTVNLASRLQSLTKEVGHEVLLNAETYHAASQSMQVEAEPLPALSVRGKREAVEVYALKP